MNAGLKNGVAGLVVLSWTMAGAAASADELKVAATIAPVHSLVAMVTEGITEPALIVRPGASPHDYALRPSEAEALDQADVVFRVGGLLETWMEKAVATLANDATVVELAGAEGLTRLDFRKGGAWQSHGHHDDGDEGHEHDSEHEHGATDIDPHL